MPGLLSDADVGFSAGPKLLSDAEVGFAAPKRASSGSQAAPVGGEYGDLSAQPWAQGEQPSPADRAPIAQIADAAVQGWKDTPSILGQPAQDALDKSPIGRQIINPAMKVLSAFPAATNALMQAVSEAVNQVTGDPRVGRDVMAALQILPVMHASLPPRLSVAAPADAASPNPRYISEITAPDVSELDPRNAIAALIQHDDMENGPALPGRGAANQGIAEIGNAPNIDSAIAAAGKAVQAPSARPMSEWMTPLPQSAAETPGAPAGSRPGGIYGGQPDVTKGPFVFDDPTAPVPQSLGAAASREQTPQSMIETPPAEAAANRLQGEVERLAMPPRQNDTAIYIPGTQPTLAEVTGDPRAAMDQKYNRQQREAMQTHIEQENKNAEAVADYYADTAGSAPTLQRMVRARDDRAKQNIQQVFGDPDASRPPADPTPVVDFMDGILADPRMQERDIIQKTIPNLIDRFYNEDGSLKTDPLSLYGIRQHIQDLLSGAGDPETNAAARMLRRELMQIQSHLDNSIEQAAPGFAQYRADYTNDSRAIDAMKLLQEERLSLLNKDQHITPGKWFTFMRNVVEGRADPMDPAAALSEDQMGRLWNITDQLKRSTFIDAGKPRDSGTSQLLEWGKRLGMHAGAFMVSPGIANIAVPFIEKQMKARSVTKEMNRVLNPDLGQQPTP